MIKNIDAVKGMNNGYKHIDWSVIGDLVARISEDCGARGIAVGVVSRSGSTIFERCYGFRDADGRIPVDRDTIFGLASVTKSFTALSILQLERQGLLSLYDRVSDHVPQFSGRNTLAPIRICHLLSHSAGFFPQHRTTVREAIEGTAFSDSLDSELAYSADFAQRGVELVASRLDGEREFTGLPGERYSYCNDGYGLLSDIIRTHGPYASYGEFVENGICRPLGMTRTGISFIRSSLDENASVLWRMRDDKWICDKDYTDNAFVLPGGGAMKSTLSDMMKYLAMLLSGGMSQDGTRIIDEGRIRLMEQDHISDSPYSSYGYGLGSFWMDGLRVCEHSGGLTGVSSQIMFASSAGIGTVVLCNTSSVPVSCIARAALRLALGLPEEPARCGIGPQHWPEEEAGEMAGCFCTEEGDEIRLYTAGGSLCLEVNGKPEELFRRGPWLAFVQRRWSGAWLSAMPDSSGRVKLVQYGSRIFRRSIGNEC